MLIVFERLPDVVALSVFLDGELLYVIDEPDGEAE